jgi:hypothetical protein
MTPATRTGNLAQSRSSLQREPRIASKLSIGQRLMQMDLDAAAGRRTGIAPKLTLGQRLMGLDGRGGFRVDNPQTRSGGVNGSAPTGATSGGLEMAGKRRFGVGQNAFAQAQLEASSPRPTGSASFVA